MENLPYRVAQSGKCDVRCRNCKSRCSKNSLRIAAMIQSFKNDAKEEQWYCFKCFFECHRPRSIDQIAYIENLHPDNQKKIKQKVHETNAPLLPQAGPSKAKKRKANADFARLKDFGLEYAKSGRSTCAGCGDKIIKNEVRVFYTSYETEIGKRYGGQNFSHHPACFVEIRDRYNFFLGGDILPGFNTLSKEDQALIMDVIQPSDAIGSQSKRKKKKKKCTEEKQAGQPDDDVEKIIEKQTVKYLEIRKAIENLSLGDLRKILTANGFSSRKEHEQTLDICADFLTFGAIRSCPKCIIGDLILGKGGYTCNGNIDEYTSCTYFTAKPNRQPCKIPANLKKSGVKLFSSYQPRVEDRTLRPREKSKEIYERQEVGQARNFSVKRKKREPLYGLHVAPVGRLQMSRPEMKLRIEKMGGRLVTKLQERIAVVISNEDEVEKMNQRMQVVKDLNIQVVPESFISAVEKGTREEAIENITSMSICDWGSDPLSRIPADEELRPIVKTIYDKVGKGDKQQVVKIKNGSHVDPESGLEDIAHVYRNKITNQLYNTVLNYIDIKLNKNSYYKIQLLEADRGNKYWVFRAWGRIGTKIGDHEVSTFENVEVAINNFEYYFEQQTGNTWGVPFKKLPGKFAMVEVDYTDDEKIRQMEQKSSIPSNLKAEVQELMKMIFDVAAMKNTMIQFELDLEKMPLGRLSKKQLDEAYSCLNNLDSLIAEGANRDAFIGASNKFFSLIPHNFGMNTAQIIDTVDAIKSKREMIESLLEIEIAYSMLKKSSEEHEENEINPLDSHYEKLKTDIVPLDKNSTEFELIQRYVENTHAPTHDQYKLEIMNVFKVVREGERRRFNPFSKLHNRMLLWHGSRVTNFAGILSAGLKIAPPEAPVSGYMFGKGIYFADMVSKSANYCATTPTNNIGLMLLSEVALGNVKELTRATFIQSLPNDVHSVKGVGKTMPNPTDFFTLDDGVVIPYGKQITNNAVNSELLYNEYIVYDPAQVNIQYMLKVKFNYHKRY